MTKSKNGPTFTGSLVPTEQTPQKDKKKNPDLLGKASKTSVLSVPWLKALVDPFSSDAVQLPDEYAGGTIALKLVEDYLVAVDATGSAVVGFGPTLARSYYSTTIASGAITASNSAFHPDYTDFLAQFAYYRTLLMAVEVSYNGSDLDNQGRMAVMGSPNVDYASVGATVQGLFDDCVDPGTVRDGALVVSRPVQPPRFETTATVAHGLGTVPFITIGITGAKASTTTISVRCIKFVECQPTKGSLHRGGMSVEPYDMVTMATAANMALNEPLVHPNTGAGRNSMKQEGMDLAAMSIKLMGSTLTHLGIVPAGSGEMASAAYTAVKKALAERKAHK